jgi:hypothetical protein
MWPTIEPWKKALAIAACIELPLMVVYMSVSRAPGWNAILYNLLGIYHLAPIMIFGIPLVWIGQFIPQGPSGHFFENALFCCTIYAGQVALTTPITFYIIKIFSRRRITSKYP